MTKRFFYTDPLAAAWMMKHHKMHIVDKYGDEIEEAYRRDPQVWLDPPYYIHPDSLHLLEPQIGDLVATRRGNESTTLYQPIELGGPKFFIEEFILFGKTFKWEEIVRVVLRNGIAFMWPESEEAHG